jgi:hypothetical protein
VLQIQKAFCNAKQKSIVQSFTHASACNASQLQKSVAISAIATILGLLQHFLGVETGSKFSSELPEFAPNALDSCGSPRGDSSVRPL